MKNYIKINAVSKKLTGKDRRLENQRFKSLIDELNQMIEDKLNSVEVRKYL